MPRLPILICVVNLRSAFLECFNNNRTGWLKKIGNDRRETKIPFALGTFTQGILKTWTTLPQAFSCGFLINRIPFESMTLFWQEWFNSINENHCFKICCNRNSYTRKREKDWPSAILLLEDFRCKFSVGKARQVLCFKLLFLTQILVNQVHIKHLSKSEEVWRDFSLASQNSWNDFLSSFNQTWIRLTKSYSFLVLSSIHFLTHSIVFCKMRWKTEVQNFGV